MKYLPRLFALILISGLTFSSCKSKRNSSHHPEIPVKLPEMPHTNDTFPSQVPAIPDSIGYALPDGYILRIFLRGDEHFHLALTTDGFQLVMNPEGFYEYTYPDDQGLPQSTGIIARNPEDRSQEDRRVLKGIKPIQ